MIHFPLTQLRDLLVNDHIIDVATFDALTEEATRKRQALEDVLVSRGLVTKEYLYDLLAKAINVPRANFAVTPIDPSSLALLPEPIARERRAIVFGKTEDGAFAVAMEDPTDLSAIDFLALKLGGPVRPFIATDDDLNRGFAQYDRKMTESFTARIEEAVRASVAAQARGESADIADLPVVELLDTLMAYAASSRASDIHFDVLDDELLVRYRIDGILHEILRMPKAVHPSLLARVKILANLRVDEHARPQDGRFRHTVGGEAVDVRASIIPTFYGEKVELRLFTSAEKPLSLEELGFLGPDAERLRWSVEKTYGMVLVTGPTGSGKTTTLYSLVNMLNRPEVNIVTVEDPIEYDMRYVNQVQVNNAAGITFASGLRSILRQDPNVIMVGEVRDGETASIAVQAALTGHLVLSSLHTNDAPTAVPRLTDMGVPPFLVAAVLNTIVAQRLVRKVHTACIESYTPDPAVVAAVGAELNTLGISHEAVRLPGTFYRGKGCDTCGGTGYFGRIGIFEVMAVGESVRKSITGTSFDLDALRRIARAEGMVTMFEDGLRKVERGMTTIEEVFRVIRE